MRLPSEIKTLMAHVASNSVSETLQKVSRIAVVVVVARAMEAEAIGLAAAAITAGDILKAFTENGVTQRIVAARDADLEDVTATARRIFGVWCLGLTVVQILLAYGVYLWTGATVVPLLIALLALEYLVMPAGLVQCALAMRTGKMTGVAAVAGGQIIAANLLTALAILIWPVAIMLVLPRVVTAPLWLIGMRRLHPWRRAASARIQPLGPFVRYGGFVLSTEVLKMLRLQADKLLVGALLGAEALGAYFFAFSAGLGIATSFSDAFARVFFPHLCQARNRAQALRQGMVLALMAITPLVLLQALLAPLYVPLIFGARWAEISSVVGILCLAAIPATIWAAAAQHMRAENRPEAEMAVTAILAAALLLMTWITAPYGLVTIAWGYLIVATTIQIAAALPALRLSLSIQNGVTP